MFIGYPQEGNVTCNNYKYSFRSVECPLCIHITFIVL